MAEKTHLDLYKRVVINSQFKPYGIWQLGQSGIQNP